MTIHLDSDTKRLIRQEVEAGRFRDAASLISIAIRHLLVTREVLGYSREEIDAILAKSVESLERGEGVDGDESSWNLSEKMPSFDVSDEALPALA